VNRSFVSEVVANLTNSVKSGQVILLLGNPIVIVRLKIKLAWQHFTISDFVI
jgi:hypothetical protein